MWKFPTRPLPIPQIRPDADGRQTEVSRPKRKVEKMAQYELKKKSRFSRRVEVQRSRVELRLVPLIVALLNLLFFFSSY